jgi:hypothetical protein
MTTIGKITEQIYRLYNGGNPSDDAEITKEEVKLLVGQSVNKLLKVEHLTVNKASGDQFPPHTMISTHTISSVATHETNKAKATLPVYPISLPRNMGVWAVGASGDADQQYIPIQSGQFTLLRSQDVLQFLDDQVGYYVEGRDIIFTKDITASPYNVSSLKAKLLVVDATTLGEYDYLAIPAEMEDTVIKDVLQMLGAVKPVTDKVSDANNTI